MFALILIKKLKHIFYHAFFPNDYTQNKTYAILNLLVVNKILIHQSKYHHHLVFILKDYCRLNIILTFQYDRGC